MHTSNFVLDIFIHQLSNMTEDNSAGYNAKEIGISNTEINEPKIHSTNATERCGCGCVPNIMSLFEMAALRAKKRESDALKLKNDPK